MKSTVGAFLRTTFLAFLAHTKIEHKIVAKQSGSIPPITLLHQEANVTFC